MFLARSLQMFIVVAEELHFGRAAERLHMTQPPLSQQIRELESKLNAQLFIRTTREVHLTTAGKLLLDRARRLCAESESAELAVRRIGEGKAGYLALGFVNSSVYELMPKIIAYYREEVPDVDLEIREMTSKHLTEALLTNRIDVALLRPPSVLKEASLESHLISSEEMLLALPKEHPLARYKRVKVQCLEGVDFVHYDLNCSPHFREVTERIFLAAQVRPHVVYESLLPTVLSLVEGGMGVALVPVGVSRLLADKLVYRPLIGFTGGAAATLYCSFRHGNTNPLIAKFVDILKALSL